MGDAEQTGVLLTTDSGGRTDNESLPKSSAASWNPCTFLHSLAWRFFWFVFGDDGDEESRERKEIRELLGERTRAMDDVDAVTNEIIKLGNPALLLDRDVELGEQLGVKPRDIDLRIATLGSEGIERLKWLRRERVRHVVKWAEVDEEFETRGGSTRFECLTLRTLDELTEKLGLGRIEKAMASDFLESIRDAKRGFADGRIHAEEVYIYVEENPRRVEEIMGRA